MTEPKALPEHIGPYRVTGRLGRGGMGEVLSGHDDRLDRPVALKRIHAGESDPEKARQRFRREARVVARLSHQAIVQVYDWVETDGRDWLVMELIEGRPLDDVLAGGPLPVEHATAIAREVARGLAEAHDSGLVHRDLKAGNVMVIGDAGRPDRVHPDRVYSDRVKILDFGIAKQVGFETASAGKGTPLSTLTETGQLIGTVSAMSPEQALGYPVDHRSDLFSLGILLYKMLSGVSPFQGGNAVETLSRICSARETPLRQHDPRLPEGLARLVGQLLEKEPARRPAGARQVVAELDRWAAETGGGARPEAETAVRDELVGRPRPAADMRQGHQGERQQVSAVKAPPTDATLRAGVPEGAASLGVSPDSEAPGRAEEDPGTDSAPRALLRWGVPLAVAGVLIAVGLWWSSSRLGPPDEEPAVDASTTAAQLPEAEPTSHELYQSGMAYLERPDRKGNIDKAITDFQRALALDENSTPALAGLARAYLTDFYRGSRDPQRLEQALAAAEQAVRLDEHLAVSRVSLGQVYSRMGRFEDAVRELEKALEIEPLNGDAWSGLGTVSVAQGNLPQAEDRFLRAIAAQPDNPFYHASLGLLYYQAGRYEEAADVFLRHLELTPDNFGALRNLGASYYMQGRLPEAATQFQKALQIKPDSTVYTNLGAIYFAQGLYSQSVSASEKAIESGGSNNYQLWGNLGDACRWTPGHEERAREIYLRAIQLLKERLAAKPRDPTLRTRLALYLAKRGDCEQALSDIDKIGNLPSDDGSAWFRQSVAHEICDRRDDALAALEVALQAHFPIEEVRRDPELLSLRQDVRYHRLEMRFQSD